GGPDGHNWSYRATGRTVLGWLAGLKPATPRSTIWCSAYCAIGTTARRERLPGEATILPPGPYVPELKLMSTQAEFEQAIQSGELIESPKEMTPEYLRELKHTLIVSGDTELISAPAYYLAAKRAPTTSSKTWARTRRS